MCFDPLSDVRKMDVLQVATASTHPEPANGHKRRIDGLVSARRPEDTVDRWSEIASISVDVPDEPIELGNGYREYRWRSIPQLSTRALTARLGVPEVLSYYGTSLSGTPRLDELVDAADVILVELPYHFRYVHERKPADTPIVYSSHNFEPDLIDSPSDSPIAGRLYERVWAQERYAVTNADLIVVCSDPDASRYGRYFAPTARTVTLPNAATPEDAGRHRTEPPPPPIDTIPTEAVVCMFVGTEYGPNTEAVEHIVEMSEHPDVRGSNVHFLVLGSVGNSFADLERENVHCTGFVDDLDPFYHHSDLGLNPMRSGGGSNVKVPEYLAHGLPVLTTPFGVRGFDLDDRAFVTVAELESFPGILSNLDGPELEQHGKLAREYAESTLNWEQVSRRLWDELLDLVGNPGPDDTQSRPFDRV